MEVHARNVAVMTNTQYPPTTVAAAPSKPDDWKGMNLGKRLRWARKKLNLTQVQLSERSGVDQQTISSLERFNRGSSRYPAQLASALEGISVEWLINGEGQPWIEKTEDDIVEELHQTIKTMNTQKLKLLKNFLRDLDSL